MANMAQVTVVSSKKTKTGSYLNKLVAKGEKISTPLGEVEGSGKTYYMFTDKVNKKGKKAELDLDMFDIVIREFTFDNDEGEETTAELKYLFPMRDEE